MGLLCNKTIEQIKIHSNDSKNIDASDISFSDTRIPDDQYLCPSCDKVPEILNIHADNGYIELKCKYHGKIYLTLQDYYLKMEKNSFTYFKTKCFNCNKEQKSKDNMFKYCYYCKVDFCEDCANDFHQREKEHRHNHLDVCIPVNEKNHKCLEHFNSDILSFCLDCQENICEKENTTKHRGHEKINLFTFNKDIIQYIAIIKEKNKILSNIIRFNQIVLNSYEKFQNNYFNIKSLINIGKTIDSENQRDSKELDIMINGLEKSRKIQKKAIESLQKKFSIDLDGHETKLSLRKRNLGDNGFNLISKIQFINLKEIDISENGIKNIEPLNNMNLPHLEYLNMSNNEIEKIEPIAELNSKKLKEICLQNNKIQDFSSFLKSEFPELERLRVENNNFDKSLQSFKDLINKKYKNKVFYIAKTPKDFETKYGREINLDEEIIDLSHLKGKDELLQELYLIVKPDNKIKELKLDDNEIKNASLLSRIPLNKLKMLDLSLNNITNLQFLTEMKMPKLTTIYLNANKINDIYPLIQINDTVKNFPNLYIISLKENNLNIKDKESKRVIKTLLDRKIELDLELPKK